MSCSCAHLQSLHDARFRPLLVRSLGPDVPEGTRHHWHALDGLSRRKPCTTRVSDESVGFPLTQCTGELSYRIPGALRGPSGHAREMVRFDPIQPCAARAARPTARPHGRCQPMADHGAERASSAAGSSRKPTNDAGARKNASSSKVCAAGWHQAAAQGMAGGCGIVSSACAADSQPLG